MAQTIQFKRGTNANRLLFTPAVGEPIFTIDTKKFFVGDGTTAGGIHIIGSLFEDSAPKLGAHLNMNNFVLQDGYGNTAFFANGDLSTGGGYMQMGASPGVRLSLYPSSLGGQAVFQGNIGTLANKYLEINPTINDIGTSGWTGLSINVTETLQRTGAKNLIDLKLGGVSKFKVDNAGSITASGILKLGSGGVLTIGQSGNDLSIVNNIAGGKILFNKAIVSVASIEATSFIKTLGTSSQFLKADGSVDSSTYSATSHNHDAVYEKLSNKGMANGYAPLDGAAQPKIPVQFLPALAITSTFSVATEVAQLALTAQEGDVAVRSDLNKSYIHNGGVFGTMSDWTLLSTPTDSILSVFGRVGAISSANGDYTASQITNVPSGAVAAITVQAAINELDTEKLALAGGTLTGALTLSGAPTVNLHAATKLYVDTHTIDGGTF